MYTIIVLQTLGQKDFPAERAAIIFSLDPVYAGKLRNPLPLTLIHTRLYYLSTTLPYLYSALLMALAGGGPWRARVGRQPADPVRCVAVRDRWREGSEL